MQPSTGKHEAEAQPLASSSVEDGEDERELELERQSGEGVPAAGSRESNVGAMTHRSIGDEDSRAHTHSANGRRLCRATNRRGEPCQSFATVDGLCYLHANPDHARRIGRKGGLGKKPTPELADDDRLRDSARDVIARGLEGDESITKTMLDAARSVFSFRAAQPPAPERENERLRPVTKRGRPVTGLTDVLAFGLEVAPEQTEQMIASARQLAASDENRAAAWLTNHDEDEAA